MAEEILAASPQSEGLSLDWAEQLWKDVLPNDHGGACGRLAKMHRALHGLCGIDEVMRTHSVPKHAEWSLDVARTFLAESVRDGFDDLNTFLREQA